MIEAVALRFRFVESKEFRGVGARAAVGTIRTRECYRVPIFFFKRISTDLKRSSILEGLRPSEARGRSTTKPKTRPNDRVPGTVCMRLKTEVLGEVAFSFLLRLVRSLSWCGA